MKQMRGLLLGTASMAVLASGQSIAQEEDEIIVTGIRGSIERGLNVKRNADSIVDAISAEELGKFPDTNVAESLQRVTGIAITRSRGGEGQFVTVRGLGQEFNILTFKGRELATENAGREFSFDVLPSELISAAQVFKSPTASQTDGSIGGLVNIETASALRNPGFHGAGQVGTQYEGLADDFGFKASGVLSNTFFDDTVGIIGSFSYQDRDFRTDTAESINIDAVNDCRSGICLPPEIPNPAFDPNNPSPSVPAMIPNPDFQAPTRLNSFNANLNQEERERIGASLQLEWEPNENTSIVIDGLYTSFESPSNSDSFSVFTQPLNVVNAVADADDDLQIQQTNFGANGTSNNFGVAFTNIFDLVARRANADTETFQIGGNYKQTLSDTFRVELDASYSEADGIRDNIGGNNGTGSFFVVGFPGLNFSTSPGDGGIPNVEIGVLPSFDVFPGTTLPAGANVAAELVSIDQLQAENSRLHFSRNSSNAIRDEVFTIKGDAEWDFSDTATLKIGADYVTRTKANDLIDNTNTFCGDGTIFLPSIENPGPNGGIANAFFCDRSLGFASFLDAGQLGELLEPFNGESVGFLSSTDANLPRNFPLVNIDVVEQAFLNLGQTQGIRVASNGTLDPDDAAAFDINDPTTFTVTESGTVAQLSGVSSFLDAQVNSVESFSVDEAIVSAYTQLDFEGLLGNFPYQANAGLRVTRTRTTTVGASSDFTFITIDPLATGGSGNNPVTVSNVGTQTVSNTFVDVLPSFNIGIDLQDNLKLRAGFSRSLARPTFNDLSPVVSVTQVNEGTESTASGNPNLVAVESTNIDGSLEWYGDNGLSLSGAVFFKDISNFVANGNSPLTITIPDSLNVQTNASAGPVTVTFDNASPVNGSSATLYGIEIGGQYLHDSGFGVLGNITLVENNTSGIGGASVTALENISDFAANASVFYENHGIQARISLNHRSDFLASTEGEGGFADFADDFTQVDFTTSYSFEQFTGYDVAIFAEGQNIFNEQQFTFSERATFLETFIDNGSRWLFGVRGSF